MKHFKKMKTCIISLFAIALMIGNVVRVAAYTADTSITGYPIIIDNMRMTAYSWAGGSYNILSSPVGELQEQNSYYFAVGEDTTGLGGLVFGNSQNFMVFPYDPVLYDYYIVGTFASSEPTSGDYSFSPYYAEILYYADDAYVSDTGSEFNKYPFEGANVKGLSFSFKAPFSKNTTISEIRLGGSNEATSLIGGDCYFSASIIPVAKGADYTSALNSIITALNQINQNIITSNTLQQQTIDAIKADTTNTTNWFTTLISNLSTWYYQRKEDLSNWFLDVDTRLSSGFTALYSQMTKEQSELLDQMTSEHEEELHGYDTTKESDINTELSGSLGNLEDVEKDVTNVAFEGMSEYTITENVVDYAPQFLTTFPMVASMLQSIFDSSDELGIMISVIFTVTIVSMVIGLYRYRSD